MKMLYYPDTKKGEKRISIEEVMYDLLMFMNRLINDIEFDTEKNRQQLDEMLKEEENLLDCQLNDCNLYLKKN